MQDLRDTDRQGRRTAGASQDGGFTDVLGHRFQRFRSNRKTPAADGLCHRNGIGANDRCRAVHGEVHTRLDHRSSHHRHDRHKGLHQHAAVPDVTGMAFTGQQLGRGARSDQRMETRDRAAGNGDEQEREQTALPHRPGAVDELGQGRHFQLGHGDQDADRQGDDSTDLEEGRQVVTGCQNQPHRQHRRDKTVADQHPGDLHAGEAERLGPHRIGGNLPTEPDRTEQQRHADHRDFTDAARADVAHVDAHEHRDRDGRHHREHAPRAFGQGLDHDQRQHREDDDHDQEAAEQGDGAGDAAHFFTDHVAQGTTVAPGGQEQDHEVLHRTGQHHAGNQPQRTGQVAHLCRQDRSDQGPRAGNRREVVTEEHVFVGRHEVQAVIVEHGGRSAIGIELHHFIGDEQAVVAVCNEVDGDCSDYDPEGVDGFAAAQGHDTQRERSQDSHGKPGEVFSQTGHSVSPADSQWTAAVIFIIVSAERSWPNIRACRPQINPRYYVRDFYVVLRRPPRSIG
ncbi:hypothetical protein PS874_05173 [Pseudomonas fluorescens]|nr:hypothetical protein PS874_05173 [Pseudomonas fluorescens]